MVSLWFLLTISVLLCAVFVPAISSRVNLALGKSAIQSSTSKDDVASKAVDGNRNAIAYRPSCSKTLVSKHEYWQVDLGAEYLIDEITIVTRLDCCLEFINHVRVIVKTPDSSYQCGTLTSKSQIYIMTLQCNGARGNVVLLEKQYDDPYPLILCEVEVYGRKENLALGKTTGQSSTHLGGNSSRAVDGNTSPYYSDNSCSQTESTGVQYWRVDLGAEYENIEVVIFNRLDCCSEELKDTNVYLIAFPLDLRIDYLCGTISNSTLDATQVTVQCKGHRGQLVYIEKRDNTALTLCEVEVYTT